MIKLKPIYEINLSRPYRLTDKGKDLIEDFTHLHDLYSHIISKYGNKDNNIALENAVISYNEYHIRMWLEVGFGNKEVNTPQMFIKNVMNEGFVNTKEEGLEKWNEFIKLGYIK